MELIFKNNIEKLAVRNKFSLTKISELSGVSLSTLSRIFSGKIKKPNQVTINQIAEFFKVPAHLLLSQDIDSKTLFQEEFKHSCIKDRLTYLMKKHSIVSVDELSFMSDVPLSTIKSILQGETDKIHLTTSSKFAEFFNISLPQFKCEEDLFNKKTNQLKNIPVIIFSNFNKWQNNLVKKQYVKEYRDYINEDNNDYFMIEVDSSLKLNEFDIGDMLVFLKEIKIKSNGKYLCEINNILSVYKIFIENNFLYRSFNNKKILVEQNEILIYGKLVEIKIDINKE